MYAMGVSIYGQMTAGSYCYIGPQGIVHGTTLTILNASRKYLNQVSASEVDSRVPHGHVLYAESCILRFNLFLSQGRGGVIN